MEQRIEKLRDALVNGTLGPDHFKAVEFLLLYYYHSPKLLDEFWQRSSDACPLEETAHDDELIKFRAFVHGKMRPI